MKLAGKALTTAGAFGAAVASIELAARINVGRERERRAYLGDQLYKEVRGEGPPIVLLAGLQASTRFWQGAFDSLATGRRLIFVDALGFGRSPWPEAGYTLDDQLGALRRTLVSLGATEGLTFIAHSFGTLLAAEYGSRHPQEVERLMLLGTPVFTDEEDARARIRKISPVAAFFSFNRFFAREACMAMCAFRPLLEKVLPPLEPRVPREVVADAVLHYWPAVDGALRKILLTHPIAVPLARIGSKVTFVHGRCDGITPLSRVRDLAAETGARLVETDDEHLSYPARSAEVVIAAVERP